MALLLRRAKESEVDVLVAHWKRFMALFIGKVELDMRMVPEAPKRIRRFYLKTMRSRNSTFIVAERSDRIVGYAMGTVQKRPPVYRTRTQGYVTEIYLEKSERGKGTGKLLMDELIKWARKKGQEQLALNVHPENRRALRFYARMGFRPVFHHLVKTL